MSTNSTARWEHRLRSGTARRPGVGSGVRLERCGTGPRPPNHTHTLSGTDAALPGLVADEAFRRITTMVSATYKIKGAANQVGGKVKEGVGKAIGNEQMQVEGMAQQ